MIDGPGRFLKTLRAFAARTRRPRIRGEAEGLTVEEADSIVLAMSDDAEMIEGRPIRTLTTNDPAPAEDDEAGPRKPRPKSKERSKLERQVKKLRREVQRLERKKTEQNGTK